MIFGWSPAVFIMTSLTKPLIQHLHRRGVRASIYIDDGRIVGKDRETVKSHLQYAISVFQQAGWNVQQSKTSTEPVQKLYFLGYWCDTVLFQYSIAEFKVFHIKQLISRVLQEKKCKLKEISAIAGKLMAAVKAFGPVVPVMLRSSFYFISQIFKAVGQDCYETTVFLTPRVTMDLQFLHDTLDQYNGYPIFANKIGFCLNSALEEGDLKKASLELQETEGLWVSDSSDIKAVAYNPYKIGSEISIHSFSVSETELSSSAREFLAVSTTITRMQEQLLSSGLSTLYWLTDSQVLAIWLQKGSKVLTIQRKLVELFSLLFKLKIRIVPIWKPRDNRLISLADQISKFRDTDDWGISKKYFRVLEFVFKTNFTLDVFANGTNWKVKKFFSKVAAPGSYGVNAFMQDWRNDVCYVCPPVNFVIETYKYITAVPCKGVLVFPHWMRNPFWPVLTIDGIHLQPEFKKSYHFYPEIVTGPENQHSNFKHGVKKKMIAAWFDSSSVSQQSSLSERCLLEGCGMCS